MLAKLADALPAAGDFSYEPKWDGFRAIVFRGGDDVFIQSRAFARPFSPKGRDGPAKYKGDKLLTGQNGHLD